MQHSQYNYSVGVMLDTHEPLTGNSLEHIGAIAIDANGRIGNRRLNVTLNVRAHDIYEAMAAGVAEITAVVPGQLISLTATTFSEVRRNA